MANGANGLLGAFAAMESSIQAALMAPFAASGLKLPPPPPGPAQLLKGSRAGEPEPKADSIFSVPGIAVQAPIAAMRVSPARMSPSRVGPSQVKPEEEKAELGGYRSI
mgnify:CR=1 FL=1